MRSEFTVRSFRETPTVALNVQSGVNRLSKRASASPLKRVFE